jgi:hypothetical protein
LVSSRTWFQQQQQQQRHWCHRQQQQQRHNIEPVTWVLHSWMGHVCRVPCSAASCCCWCSVSRLQQQPKQQMSLAHASRAQPVESGCAVHACRCTLVPPSQRVRALRWAGRQALWGLMQRSMGQMTRTQQTKRWGQGGAMASYMLAALSCLSCCCMLASEQHLKRHHSCSLSTGGYMQASQLDCSHVCGALGTHMCAQTLGCRPLPSLHVVVWCCCLQVRKFHIITTAQGDLVHWQTRVHYYW